MNWNGKSASLWTISQAKQQWPYCIYFGWRVFNWQSKSDWWIWITVGLDIDCNYQTLWKSLFASNCAAKLRQQKSVAFSLMVFVHTNHYRKDLPQYAKSIIVNLPVPTSDTGEIVRYAEAGLKKIFLPGYRYKRLGLL